MVNPVTAARMTTLREDMRDPSAADVPARPRSESLAAALGVRRAVHPLRKMWLAGNGTPGK